jgi:hypothetical protein
MEPQHLALPRLNAEPVVARQASRAPALLTREDPPPSMSPPLRGDAERPGRPAMHPPAVGAGPFVSSAALGGRETFPPGV